MRRVLAPVVVVFAFASVHPVLAAVEDDAKTVSSQISEVTVYADRARVTRTASAEIGATQVIAFRKLPGWVDEGSVRVALVPADAGQILDVEVERNHLTEPESESVRKAEAAVRDVNDKIAALDDETKVLDAQARQIDAIRLFAAEKLPKDSATREVKVAEFGQIVDYVAKALRENAVAKRDVEKKRRDLVPEQQAKLKSLAEVQERAQLEQRTVRVTLKGGSAPKHATIKLTYMLPGATWEPASELRATNDGASVTLASFAQLSQTTGEDWDGATVTFSTQRPNETMRLPEVGSLLLGNGTLARVVNPSADSFAAASSAYVAQNAVIARNRADYAGYYAQQQEVQSRITAVFQELQERGTTAHFAAMNTPTIRADGKPVRVPIGNATLAAEHRLLAAPEVSLNAAHTLDLLNTGDQPILPGKMALYFDGAFLGNSETDFVSPGEKFSAFAGVADRIKLARTLDKKKSALERGGKKTKISVSWVVSAENLGNAPVTLAMADRIPVSENDEIRVSNIRVTPDLRPDAQGLLKWNLPLAAKQAKQYRLEYTIEYPSDLLMRLKMMEQRSPASPSPAAAPKNSINYEDLERLEKSL